MRRFAGAQFSTFKNELAELAVAKLGPITKEMRRLMADTGEIDKILKASAEKVEALAEPVLRDVKRIVGYLN